MTVLIADFQNTTNDPTFDNTLGQTLRRALEDASFITAFDRNRVRSTFGVAAPEKFDEVAARELAVKQGLGVVLAGSIAPRGDGYDITVKATQPMTGNVITSVTRRASSKDQVLDAVTRVVTSVRNALGDETSDSAQLLAMKRLSTTSLDVASHYAAAVNAQSRGNAEEALASFSKAVELDPKFGLGYQGLAVDVPQPGPAAGCGEVRRRSAPVSRRDDGARTVCDARLSTTFEPATISSASRNTAS